jgi:GH25 family lysozyme M1 (1,4-beta-N-acetylmuramidase)
MLRAVLNRIESRVARTAILCALILLKSVAPATADSFIHGVDVYYGDGVVNWTTAKNTGGIQFAFVKATDGVVDIDPKFTSNMQGATNAGVLVGPYHLCRVASRYIDSTHSITYSSYDGLPFPVNSDPYLDATAEAHDFIDAVRPYYQSGSYLPPVADIETSIIESLGFTGTTLRKTFVSNWLQLFSDSVKNALGVRPIIYTSESSANTYYSTTIASTHKLWEAWWKDSTAVPPLQSNTPTWPLWTFWQYTASAQIPGVPGSNNSPNFDEEDADVFNGTLAQLQSLLVHVVPGDYNHDGFVNMADYVVWRDTKGSNVNLSADGSGNGVVENADYTFWRSHFGQTSGSGSGSGADFAQNSVPGPGTVFPLSIAAVAASTQRRKRTQR